MRKIIALALAAAALSAVFVAPATAAKPKGKRVTGSVSGTLLPFPKDERWHVNGVMPPGCVAGQEGVHWVGQEFTSPGKGTLRFYMEGFTGDHDIYIFGEDMNVPLMRGDQVQVGQDLAPPEEEIQMPLKKGQTVLLVACNWAGQPDVTANYEGLFK